MFYSSALDLPLCGLISLLGWSQSRSGDLDQIDILPASEQTQMIPSEIQRCRPAKSSPGNRLCQLHTASYSFILISISGNQEEFFGHLLWQSSNPAVTVVIQSAVTTWMTTSTKRFRTCRTCRTCRRRQLWLRSHLLWLQELGETPGIYTQRAWTRDMDRHGETWRQICFKMWPGHAYMVHFV